VSNRDRGSPSVEEVEVDGKAHPEGVDARAARDQQPRSGPIAVKASEAEQAGPEADRNRDLQPEYGPAGKRSQAGIHPGPRPALARALPR
jgi:hypothetical protein